MKLLQELLIGLPVQQLVGPVDLPINALCFNSQQVTTHSCFIAIAGARTDGHRYIMQAIAAGSCVIVCERLPDLIQLDVTYVVVKHSASALGIMAANFYDHPSRKLKLIAVTGTNGKTTTVHLLYHMVTQMGYRAGILSTICNKIVDQTYPATLTTPNALHIHALLYLMVEAECQYCFIEASSHALNQARLAGLHLTGALFTNITHDHLDYHIDFSNYIQAKKKLFDQLPSTSFALVNQQDKNSSVVLQHCKARKFTFSLYDLADFRAKIVAQTLYGLEMEIDYQRVWFQLIGPFNASNLLAVYATARLLGLERQESLLALSAIPPIRGRMQRVLHKRKFPQVFIDYAHTPDAIEKAVTTLHALRPRGGRLVTVMGCGGNRDKEKRAMIGYILANHSDRTIFTSDNPRDEDPQEIIDAMQKNLSPSMAATIITIVDRAMAIKTACILAHPHDILLIAGRGHEQEQEIKGIKRPFCDEAVIKSFLEISCMPS